MNSNGNAPRRANTKKKKTVVQKAALMILKVAEGKDKKAVPKHSVNTQRTPAPAQRPVQKRAEQKKPAQRIPVQQRPVQQRPVQQRSNQARANNQTRPAVNNRKVLIKLVVRQLPKMKKQLYIGSAVVAVLLIMLILSRTVLFKIDNIVVTNPSEVSYTTEQISTETGIVSGTQNLFSCDLEKIEKNIEQRLPYIGEAYVEKDFPSSLKITVISTSVSAALVHGAGYILIDENGKMLEYTQMTPEAVPTLRTSVEITPEIGHYIGDKSKLEKGQETNAETEMIRLFGDIRKAAEAAGLLDGITLIDIRDERALTLMYENRLTLHLGNESRLETKLQTGAGAIAAESDSQKTRTGAIDLSIVGSAFVMDTFEEVTQTEETTEPEEN